MKLKRILSVVMGTALVGALTAFNVSASDGYYWLEAEDALVGSGFEIKENAMASGGKVVTLYQTQAHESGSYNVGFSFENEEEGNYDIWFLSGAGASNSLSKIRFCLNGGDIEKADSTGEQNPVVYTQKVIFSEDVMWNRFLKDVSLPQGTNTIDFIINEKAITGLRNYINLIDAVVVVPSAWEWQPSGSLEAPEKAPAGFAWIELEKPDCETKLSTVTSKSASKGSMLYAYDMRPVEDDEYSEEIYYSFEVDKNGEYDIWYLGCGTNSSASHLSGMYWDIDSSPAVSKEYRNENPQTGPKIINSAGSTNAIPLYWQKLGTKTLEEGSHKLNLTYAYRTLAGAKRAFMVWADCAMVIPSEWNWTPPETAEEVVLPAYTAGMMAGEDIAKRYFSGDYSSVISDISVPQNPKNPIGAAIGFESENEDIIDNTGRVQRPYFTGSDETVRVNITAEYGGVTAYYPLDMTVKKLDKYSVSDISVSNDVLSPSQTVTASVNAKLNVEDGSEVTGTGTLLMLLYNDKGALCDIAMKQSEILNTGTDISADMTLPENITGYTLKAYLLNGLNMANRLADTVEIR